MSMSEREHEPKSVEALVAGFPVVVHQAVVWGEMDAYGNVNNVVYFRYFENARLEYFRQMGWFAFEDATGIGPILVATKCQFLNPLTYPDSIAIAARVTSVRNHSFTLEHRVVSQAQGLITAEGEGVVVSYHYARKEKVPLPDELRRRIAALEGQAGGPAGAIHS